MYFTTLALLKKSDAAKSRIDSVQRMLRTLSKTWQDEWVFPIAVIAYSNSIEDLDWVVLSPGVHANSRTKIVDISGTKISEFDLNALLSSNGVDLPGKVTEHSTKRWVANNLAHVQKVFFDLSGVDEPWMFAVSTGEPLVVQEALIASNAEVPTYSATVQAILDTVKSFDDAQVGELLVGLSDILGPQV